jgi:hypothetical protein
MNAIKYITVNVHCPVSESLVIYLTKVSNATFNNISFISWRQILLVEETGVPGENHQSAASY